MSSIWRSLIIIVLAFVSAKTLNAQLKVSNYEIGINAGSLIYQGDLSKSILGDYKSSRPALGIYVSKALDPYFSLRASLLAGKVAANDSKYQSPLWKQYRNFNFSSTITELSTSLVFNLFGEGSDYRKLSPYVFAGAGVSFTNIKRDWSKVNTSVYDSKSSLMVGLAIDTVHSLPKVLPVLPVGIGLKYALSRQFALSAEATYRFTTSDYLDGFSYSANSSKRDGYYGISLGISYKLGGYKCPKSK